MTATTTMLLLASTMHAAPCAPDPSLRGADPALAEVDPRLRHAYLSGRLGLGARRARAWSIGWGVTYATSSVVQLAVTPAVDAGTRTDLYVGATSAAIGALVRAVAVPRVVREARRLRRSPAEPWSCADVQRLERALARSAKAERRGRHVLMHLASIAYNVSVGLVLGLGFDRPLSGIRQATIGGTVAQIMFLTQPMTSAETLDGYRRARLAPQTAFAPLVLPRGGGLVWRGRF